MSTSETVTDLLVAWGKGDEQALDRLTPLVYDELRRLAKSYLRRERPDHTLQPTALVHEAYMRLMDLGKLDWQNRAHFIGVAARLMRQILVDHARSRRAAKRGNAEEKLSIDSAIAQSDERELDLLAVDEALSSLASLDPEQSRIVELRFFGGLTIEETAEALGVSPSTAKREWRLARAWLYRKMKAADTRESRRARPA
jgi:RNA polymerase sigma-70 factor (ECF subfamily)